MIPNEVYLEAEIEQALDLLYTNNVTPEEYNKHYLKRYGREYEASAMADGRREYDSNKNEGDLEIDYLK